MSESYLERIASALIKDAGLPEPIREYRFHPVRRWRCDYVWVPQKIILEVEGGIWMPKARHQSPTGMSADMEKYNEASLMGFTVIRVTKAHMISGQMVEWLRRALGENSDNEPML